MLLYLYQTDTTGIGPIPIQSTGIGRSLEASETWLVSTHQKLGFLGISCLVVSSVRILVVGK